MQTAEVDEFGEISVRIVPRAGAWVEAFSKVAYPNGTIFIESECVPLSSVERAVELLRGLREWCMPDG